MYAALQAFLKLGVNLPVSTWEKVISTIDDNSTGELEYEELLAAMQRYQRGGWAAVERKYLARPTPEEEERARELFHAAMEKIRQAAYGPDHTGPRRDMDLDLKSVFEAMDKDKDRMVSKEELARYLHSEGALEGLTDKKEGEEEGNETAQDEDTVEGGLHAGLTAEELQAVFEYFDRDGGGCDFGEFAYTFYNRRQMAKRVESRRIVHTVH